jgi:hypothetical protein
MDIFNACHTLEITPKEIYTPNILRRQYYKLALLYHPDKCNGDPQKFKEINEAYSFAKEYLERNLYCGDNDGNNDYDDCQSFTTSQPKPQPRPQPTTPLPPSLSKKHIRILLKHVACSSFIVSKHIHLNENSIDVMAELLERLFITATQTQLFGKFEPFFQQSQFTQLSHSLLGGEIIQYIREWLEQMSMSSPSSSTPPTPPPPTSTSTSTSTTTTSQQTIILKPKWKDMLEGNVYRFEENIHIPLWALNQEFVFDTSHGEITFQCMFDPEPTPEDTNVIAMTVNHAMNELYVIVSKETELLQLGTYTFNLSQYYDRGAGVVCLENCGIVIFNPEDIYDISNRGNIVVFRSVH